VYVADFIAHSNAVLTSGVIFNANGSVTVSGVAGPANIVVDRAIPVPPASVGVPPSGGDDDEGGEGLEGCVAGQLPTAWMMFLTLFSRCKNVYQLQIVSELLSLSSYFLRNKIPFC